MPLVVGYTWDGWRRSGLVAQAPTWVAALETEVGVERSHSA